MDGDGDNEHKAKEWSTEVLTRSNLAQTLTMASATVNLLERGRQH